MALTGIIERIQRRTARGQCVSEEGRGLMCPLAPPTVNVRINLKKGYSAQNQCRSYIPVPQENIIEKGHFNRKSPKLELNGYFAAKEKDSARYGNLPVSPLIRFLVKHRTDERLLKTKQKPKVITHHLDRPRHPTLPSQQQQSYIQFFVFGDFSNPLSESVKEKKNRGKADLQMSCF